MSEPGKPTKSTGRGRSRGFRLQKNRIGPIRRYLTSFVTALSGQGYSERVQSSRNPMSLWDAERFVAGGGSESKESRKVVSVIAKLGAIPDARLDAGQILRVIELCYGVREGRDSLRGVREQNDRGGACVVCGLWCEEMPRPLGTMTSDDEETKLQPCEWCREFGDAVLVARTTESALARARRSWDGWMLHEGAWRWSRRSREASEEVLAARDSDRGEVRPYSPESVVRMTEEELADLPKMAETASDRRRENGLTFDVTGSMLERVERWREQGYHLTEVAEDVIERAIQPRTRDDALLSAIRAEANDRVALASSYLSAAWDDVEDGEAEAEKERVNGPVEFREKVRAASKRIGVTKPKTLGEQIDALDDLLEIMREQP